MNDEIKEILDEPKILQLSYGNYVSLDDYFKLRDCITNLQQEVQKKEAMYDSLAVDYRLAQEENERLKLEYKSQKDISQKLLSMDIKHNRELKDYKSRIEKAVEYIKGWQSFPHTNCTTHNELKNLLNILQNGSENNAR